MLTLNRIPVLHTKFLNQLPLPLLKGIEQAIVLGYERSWKSCIADLHEDTRLQGWSSIRWVKIDSELMDIVERSGNSSCWVQNTDDCSVSHAELTCGDFLLTAVCATSLSQKSDIAEYRKELAASNKLIFSPLLYPLHPDDTLQLEGKKIWAAIVHTPDRKNHVPKSIKIAFFTEGLTQACEMLDLHEVIAKAERKVPEVVVRPQIKIKPLVNCAGP